ncbi:hypothetical protein I204_08094 [Kwoniella mangroviensis CBS 8886]|uniref:uncharacterized protein n=1 Tax=Kwoniella mangroviensis CBS 8507 TaxID=1296122 RepID=UPI00080D2D5F|nr:uncharacterized protein I203_04548 [Kwoniella mangroviensis CBS 8507]OCF66222.1 hypothetical protein I203_04548 [Kwoniella mangroviensis CBS 8507]OCF71141.1 hypothetical protein I204_08094 [Kwoniella mangroviensis CBS 8886]
MPRITPTIGLIGASGIVLSACYTIFLFNRPSPGAYSTKSIISNPVASRDDLIRLLSDLLHPLVEAQSEGGARVSLGHTGTHFDSVAAEMEGYARALWGLAPLMASDPDHPLLKDLGKKWREGLEAGTDPSREDEYWGDPTDMDQRFVEMAAIGISLAIAPDTFWNPLSPEAKKRVNAWLLRCNGRGFPTNNWRFFRVLVNLGLKSVDAEYDQKSIDDELEFMESFYGEHGFPSDCPQNPSNGAYDYYATSFAIPFYSLLYAAITSRSPKLADPERAEKYRQRAKENIPNVLNLFAPDGAGIPFGRSMTYRFAISSFFAAVAYDGLELPQPYTWGVIKGIILRNIRWFTQKPQVFNRDGSLTIGWAYPSLFMSEDYNSPQSPYWALKSFFILALPESHPFWSSEEEQYPSELLEKPWTAVKPWMQIFIHSAGHTYLLNGGTNVAFPLRQTAEKYNKFAYSSSFGFSVPTGALMFAQHSPDSVLALSDDGGLKWKVPYKVEHLGISDRGVLKARWFPWPEVKITTWLVPPSTTSTPYHTRVHHISISSSFNRDLRLADSGFAIHSHFGPEGSERRIPVLGKPAEGVAGRSSIETSAVAVSRKGVSGVINLLSVQGGKGRVEDVDGNTNLISPRTVLPTIFHELKAGEEEKWIATRVWALPFSESEGLKTKGWLEGWEDSQKGYGSIEELKKDLRIT